MDDVAAEQILTEFVGRIDEANSWLTRQRRVDEDAYGSQFPGFDEMRGQVPLVQGVLEAIEPGLGTVDYDSAYLGKGWRPLRDAAIRGAGILKARVTLSTVLGPIGPTMRAAGLHPWVWEPAAALWDSGHRKSAIQSAATSIERKLASKVERKDISGTSLVTEAFTLSPPVDGKPRLRLPGLLEGSEKYKSQHEGAMSLGLGCVKAIRNLASHSNQDPDEQEGLERMATLSLFARYVDTANVARFQAPPSS